jgi:hypothetical protein
LLLLQAVINHLLVTVFSCSAADILHVFGKFVIFVFGFYFFFIFFIFFATERQNGRLRYADFLAVPQRLLT